MKKLITVVVALSLCLLTACVSVNSKTEKTVEEFIYCVAEERFEDARELLHSDCETEPDEIESYFSILEEQTKLDFAKKFQLIEYSYEEYDEKEPTVKGEYIIASGTVEAQEERIISFQLKLVKNDKDFGIYKMKFRAE